MDKTDSKKVQLAQRLRDHSFDTSNYHTLSTGVRRDTQTGRLVSAKDSVVTSKKK